MYNIGDKVVLKNPDAKWKGETTMGQYFLGKYEKTVYTVTSIYGDFTRVEGEESGWFHITFKLYDPPKVSFNEDLFTI